MLKASLSMVLIGFMFVIQTTATLINEYVFNANNQVAI